MISSDRDYSSHTARRATLRRCMPVPLGRLWRHYGILFSPWISCQGIEKAEALVSRGGTSFSGREFIHTVRGPQERTGQSQNNDGSVMGGSTPWPGLHNYIPFTLYLNLNLITRPPRRGEMAQKVWCLLCSLTTWGLSLNSTWWGELTPLLFSDTSKFDLQTWAWCACPTRMNK